MWPSSGAIPMFPRAWFLASVALALVCAGAVLYWQWPATPEVATPSRMVASPAPAPLGVVPLPSRAQDALSVQRPTIPAMADTEIDGELTMDAAGNLVLSLRVRDYLDYFLSAAERIGLEAAVAAMVDDAGRRLREPALGQFSRLLADYMDYKRASLALMQQPLDPSQSQPQALEDAFQRLARLRREHMDAAAVEAFFGAEEAYARYTLDSLALQAREDLSGEDKARAIEALRTQLPEAMRASEVRQSEALAVQAESERLWQEGAGEEQVRDFLAMTYDPPTVERLLAEQRAERLWQQRYAAYRSELAGLRGNGLSEADQERERWLLRQRLFSADDLHRVETYDAIAAKQELADSGR